MRTNVLTDTLPSPDEHVFAGDKSCKSHRASGVQLARGDAYLGAETIAISVREACGDVVKDPRGIDFEQEFSGRVLIFRNDRIGVMRSELVNVCNRVVAALCDAQGKHQRSVLGVPLSVAYQLNICAANRPRLLAASDFDSSELEQFDQSRKKLFCDTQMNQNRLN